MSDLETAITQAAKSGRLNHVTLSVKWDGGWEAGYRGVATGDYRTVSHKDPVAALIGALTGKKQPDAPKPKKVRVLSVSDDNVKAAMGAESAKDGAKIIQGLREAIDMARDDNEDLL